MKWIFFAGMFLFLSGVSFGQSSQKQIFAVLVGVTRYSDSSNNLRYPDADAIDIYRQLRRFNVPAANLELLTNEDANQEKIFAAMRKQFSRAGSEDAVLFFFSGHGGAGYLVANNMPHFLYYDSIKAIYRACKAKQKLLFADACFSGGMKQDTQSSGLKNTAATKEIKRFAESSKEVVVFASSRSSQQSKENSLLHGYFTHFLIKAMEGDADVDNNGLVSYKELFVYVNTQVKLVSDNEQIPVMFGKFDPLGSFIKVAHRTK